MATATIVENVKGIDFVYANIYNSWWFVVLWALLAVIAVLYFFKRRIRRWSVMLLHMSFIVILVGALLTHLTAWRGIVHLRMNETTETYFVQDKNGNITNRDLPYKMSLVRFRIIHYPGSVAVKDYHSEFIIDHKTCASVSLNKVYTYRNIRFYQRDFDGDSRGSVLAMNYDPYGIPITYLGYAMLFCSLLILLYSIKGPALWFNLALTVVAVGFCLFLNITHLMQTDSETGYIVPILDSSLFCMHVGIVMMSYLLFFLSFVSSMVAWISGKSAGRFGRFSKMCLYPAMFALGFGIFIGAIWANVSWGTYWSWDPKETWALITFMVYALPLHKSLWPALNNSRIYHIFMVLAFVTILMTYFGCNYFITGMHSYVN